MDWERTLNILIVAFLSLNLALAAQLWLLPLFIDPSNYVSAEQIEATVERLEYGEITIAAKIPRRLRRLQALAVNNGLFGEETAVSLIGGDFVKVSSGVKSEYHSPEGTVALYIDGRIHYTSAAAAERGTLDSIGIRGKADQFLLDTVGKPRDAVPGVTVRKPDNQWAVEYRQRWRRRALEISRIVLLVDGSGQVLEMEYYWVEVAGFAGESMLSIPSTAALMVAAENMPTASTVTDIFLSWYGRPVLADQWQANPVWVVETAVGGRYYVNAHTGELEGERTSLQEKPR